MDQNYIDALKKHLGPEKFKKYIEPNLPLEIITSEALDFMSQGLIDNGGGILWGNDKDLVRAGIKKRMKELGHEIEEEKK